MRDDDIVGEHHLKVPVVRKNEYAILLEEHLEGTFIHCEVHSWTPALARSLAADFKLLCELHGGPIHALHDSGDRKHKKFLKLYGFEWLKNHEENIEVWIWRNNG